MAPVKRRDVWSAKLYKLKEFFLFTMLENERKDREILFHVQCASLPDQQMERVMLSVLKACWTYQALRGEYNRQNTLNSEPLSYE